MSLSSNEPSNKPVPANKPVPEKPSTRLDDCTFPMRAPPAERKTLQEEPATNCSSKLTIAQRASFHQKIAMIGYGVYGQAIHSRLPDHDIVPWERASTNRESSDLAITNLSKAIDGRGLLILAVPANAFPNVLDKIRPHPDSVVVSLAKGLIVPNWNPLESERSLRDGPPEGSNACTPLEYIEKHPNWKRVASNLVFVAGPGFAKDVKQGGYVGLTLSAVSQGSERPTEALGKAFWVFSGMNGDRNIEIYNNSTALEVASSMKNIAAFAAGIILGIMKNNGGLEEDGAGGYRIVKRVSISHGPQRIELDDQTLHRLTHFASRETINVVKSEGGGKGSQLTMAGGFDMNLTVNSLASRNVQAGMRLACGENIYEIMTKLDKNGHSLTAEGVIATHAMACRIKNNASEASAPLVFALRNILMNRSTPEEIMANYFTQTKIWTESDAQSILNGLSKPHALRTHASLGSMN